MMSQDNVPCIAVITVTFNASKDIARLAQSLAEQTDKNFVWIVKDCCSSDSTISIVDRYRHFFPLYTIVSQDNGIYDGLNQAIQYCKSLFYLTAGADDLLYPTAIKELNLALSSDMYSADLYLNRIKIGKKLVEPGRGNGFLFGQHGFAANHSVGCLIRKDLHTLVGPYSTKLQVAADSLFLYSVCSAGFKLKETRVVAGEFSIGGVSTSKLLFISHAEFALVQILNHPRFRFLQIALYALRLLMNWRQY